MEIVQFVLNRLEEVGEEERIMFMKRMVPSELKMIGVDSKSIKAIVKDIKPQLINYTDNNLIQLVRAFIDTRIIEAHLVAFEILSKQVKLISRLSSDQVWSLNKHLDNWVSIDSYGVNVLGVAWHMGVVSDNQIQHLLTSNDVWQRRLGVVATVSLNLKSRGGTGDLSKTLAVCEKVVNERHPLMVKALSWALREMAKREPDAIHGFIEKYRAQLSKRVISEVMNKLMTGRKR